MCISVDPEDASDQDLGKDVHSTIVNQNDCGFGNCSAVHVAIYVFSIYMIYVYSFAHEMSIHIMCYITGGSDDGLGEVAVAAIVTIAVLVVLSAVGVCVVIAIFCFKKERAGDRNIKTSQPRSDSSRIVCERNAAYAVSKSHIRSDTTAPDCLQTDTNCKDYYSYPREGIEF